MPSGLDSHSDGTHLEVEKVLMNDYEEQPLFPLEQCALMN